MLHGKGWKISLVHEVMQWGIQPDGLIPHLKQRRRWVSDDPGSKTFP